MGDTCSITPEDIRFFVETYKRNAETKKQLEQELQMSGNREQWIRNLEHQSEEQRRMFAENETILTKYLKPVAEGAVCLNDELARALYDGLFTLYYNEIDEYPVLMGFIKPLLAFYEEKKDYEKLLNLFYAAYYETSERWIRMQPNEEHGALMEYGEKVIALKSHYSEFVEKRARRKIFSMYYNIVVIAMEQKYCSYHRAFEYIREMLQFWNSKEVQELDGQDEDFQSVVEEIQWNWISFEPNHVENLTEEELSYYRQTSEYFLRKEMAEHTDPYEVRMEVYFSGVYLDILDGRIGWEEATEKVFTYFEKHKACLEACRDEKTMEEAREDVYFYVNIPHLLLGWEEKHHIRLEDYTEQTGRVLEALVSQWANARKLIVAQYVDAEFVPICMKLLSYYKGKQQQKELAMQMMVKRHLPTYIHSVMVKELATSLLRSVMRNQPQLLVNEELKDVEAVISHSGRLLQFVSDCAMFHDLGKSRIMEIIDTQTRKITNQEFRVIQYHPEYGNEMARGVPFLEALQDIILGHHKFYNGQGGYPESFSNVSSPKRIYIDIITICDCLDAATDIRGRNYTRGKNFEQVFAELKQGSGVRYNPALVEIMDHDVKLREELTFLTGEGRYDVCYRVYEEWVQVFSH